MYNDPGWLKCIIDPGWLKCIIDPGRLKCISDPGWLKCVDDGPISVILYGCSVSLILDG